MDDLGVDAVVAVTRFNVQYMLWRRRSWPVGRLGRPAGRAAGGDVRRGRQKLLEAMRSAIKSPAELDLVRTASIGIIDSMLATFAGSGPGETKAEIVERFRREQTNRGMTFDYCRVAAGPETNRAPSDRVLARGRRAVAGLRRDVPGLHRRPRQDGGGGRAQHPRR